MTSRIRLLAAATLILGLAVLPACGGDDDPPNTPPTLELNSGNIAAAGGTYVHTFGTAGIFPYHCTIHPSMTGSVTVQAGASTAPVAISIVNMSTGYAPATVTVGIGTVVTWTNNDAIQIHTVTSD